jgi:hypothetical protein
VTLYSALDYTQRADPTKETDNLAIGVIAFPQLGLNGTGMIGNPNLDVRWITDIEQRESSQWKADLSVPLMLLETPDEWLGWLPIEWTVDGVIDYTHVIRAGDKTALAGVGEAFRAGYNMNWELARPLFQIGTLTPGLSGSYRFRDVLGKGPGNADLVTIDLSLIKIDEKTGGLGFSVGYERGENLESLEEVEAVKLKLQLKN